MTICWACDPGESWSTAAPSMTKTMSMSFGSGFEDAKLPLTQAAYTGTTPLSAARACSQCCQTSGRVVELLNFGAETKAVLTLGRCSGGVRVGARQLWGGGQAQATNDTSRRKIRTQPRLGRSARCSRYPLRDLASCWAFSPASCCCVWRLAKSADTRSASAGGPAFAGRPGATSTVMRRG